MILHYNQKLDSGKQLYNNYSVYWQKLIKIIILNCYYNVIRRLNGDSFPPIIVFKIFMESKSIKYISGKSMIRPSSEVYYNGPSPITYNYYSL